MAKKFYQQEYSKHIGATILIVLSLLAGLFTTVAIPISQLRPKSNHDACYTLWGLKLDCGGKFYDARIADVSCPEVRWRLECAMAFSIVGDFFLFFALTGACYQLSGMRIKNYVAFMMLFAIGCVAVPWTIVAALYNTNFCGNYKFHRELNDYGPGFPIFIVGWSLAVIGLILFWVLEPSTEEADRIDAEEKERRYGAGGEEGGDKKDDKKSSSSSSSKGSK